MAFWFGDRPSDAVATAKEKATLWWSKSADADREIRERFLGGVGEAAEHRLNGWEVTPGGRLALVLLTDQFPRHIYRGSRQAFAYDTLALDWCLSGVAQSVDTSLRPVERWFFYLPLQHSESLEHQDTSVALYTELLNGVSDAEKEVFEGCLNYAVRHRNVVAEFGRFPHRNALLGRQSTMEELAFLAKPCSSF